MPTLYDNLVSNVNHKVSTDVSLVTKTTTGKVIFWKAEGEPIVGLSEERDIYLDTVGNSVLIIVDRLFFYSLSFFNLTDLVGRPYVALDPQQGNDAAYAAKLKQVYEDLQSVFVGCCECGGGVSNVEFYDTVDDRPVTGEVDVLYVVKTPPSLFIWNGTDYVSVGGGSGVQSVTGYSVDNTDPLNPIVKAIPTAGTNASEPVTGDIERFLGFTTLGQQGLRDYIGDLSAKQASLNHIKVNNSFGSDYAMQLYYRDVAAFIINLIEVNNNGINITVNTSRNITVTGKDIKYAGDYSSTHTLRSLIDLAVLKSRLWNGAGAPTVTDDATQGFVSNRSLWLDTTTGLLYKCTDATLGAAVWVRETFGGFQNYTVSTGVGVVFPASSTRWYTLDGVSANPNVTNSQFVIKKALRAGVFSDPEIVTGTAQPASGSITYELYAGATPSSLSSTGVSVTIPAGSAAGIYTGSGTYTIPQGEYYAWRIVNSATGNSGQFVAASILLTF